jgi:hypothetical protein
LKTYRNLYPQVYAWENLELAYRRARKGKRAKGPAATFEFDRERNLTELQQELRQKTYRPGPYHSFIIHEPKRRLISDSPAPSPCPGVLPCGGYVQVPEDGLLPLFSLALGPRPGGLPCGGYGQVPEDGLPPLFSLAPGPRPGGLPCG